MALTAEHLIVIGKGRLIADTSVEEFIGQASRKSVRVRSPRAADLRELLAGPDVSITSAEPGVLEVTGLSSADIGRIACERSIPLEELVVVQASLEEAFMELTEDALEYRVTEATPERRAS
jgi:ABC-2 type transport system ATP-binding protein